MDVAKLDSPADNKKDEEVWLPGFRFHPTDEELVGFYLLRKVENKPLRIELIKQVDIYKYDPWDLPMNSLGDKEWYFFCIRGRKYKNSPRPNRVTRSGFWKATGIDKSIYCVKEPHQCIGLKKSLVYYRGSAGKGTKTDWMMHEFRLPPNWKSKTNNNNNPHANASNNVHEAEVWTLCRIFKRLTTYKKYTPNMKNSEAASVNKLPNQADSNTYSLDSENLVMQEFERKPVFGQVVDEKKHYFLGQYATFAHQSPSTVSYPSSWKPNVEDAVANENWDDLRSVFQFSVNDPSKAYDCTETYIPPHPF